MQESVFAPDYEEEQLQQTIDSYNLLYVACTRPKENLFILKGGGKRVADDEKKKKKASIPTTFNTVAQLIAAAFPMKEEDFVEFGEIIPNTTQGKVDNETVNINPFEAKPQPIEVAMHSVPLTVNFRQSNLSKRFVAYGDTPTLTYLDRGLLLHELFSRMNTAADATTAIADFAAQGLISDEKQLREVNRIIHRALENPQAAEWFSGKYELFNECSIVYTPGAMPPGTLCYAPDMQPRTLRPDRVMCHGDHIIVVDFKFARPTDKHKEQVARYMELLHNMGHSNVEGYVWYGYENRIEKV